MSVVVDISVVVGSSHWYPPSVFVQIWSGAQSWVPRAHSSTSMQLSEVGLSKTVPALQQWQSACPSIFSLQRQSSSGWSPTEHCRWSAWVHSLWSVVPIISIIQSIFWLTSANIAGNPFSLQPTAPHDVTPYCTAAPSTSYVGLFLQWVRPLGRYT